MGWLIKLLTAIKSLSKLSPVEKRMGEDGDNNALVDQEEKKEIGEKKEISGSGNIKQESAPLKSGSLGIGGVHGSHVHVGYKEKRDKQDDAQETGDAPNVVEGEVAEVYEDGLLGIGEGYIDGEIVDGSGSGAGQAKLLSSGNEEDFIEADWEDLIEQGEVGVLRLSAGEEFEDDLADAAKEPIETSDDFGLQAAEAFTDIVYEDDDSFTDDTSFLDNDFVPDSSNFIANAFEDQPVAAPIYPSEAMPWGAPSETSGFGSNRDESFEAEFALGGDI